MLQPQRSSVAVVPYVGRGGSWHIAEDFPGRLLPEQGYRVWNEFHNGEVNLQPKEGKFEEARRKAVKSSINPR